MIEQWRSVVGYKGFYAVSDHGSVINVRTGRILKPCINTVGYPFVSLSKNGKQKQSMVHRLVARAFIGRCKKGFVVNHIDGVKTNSHLSNLEYITYRANSFHAYKLELTARTRRGNTKLTLEQAEEIRALYRTGQYTQETLASMYPISRTRISNIVSGSAY
jgi:hypothetical protein